MKNYTITVNGTAYNVSVEEGVSAAPVAAAPVAAAPAPAPAAAPAPVAPAADVQPAADTAVTGAVTVDSPMPGTILDIKVASGAAVKSGDVLFVLEAMKMENEIVAPQDGTVASVNVSKGDSVEAGQTLASLN